MKIYKKIKYTALVAMILSANLNMAAISPAQEKKIIAEARRMIEDGLLKVKREVVKKVQMPRGNGFVEKDVNLIKLEIDTNKYIVEKSVNLSEFKAKIAPLQATKIGMYNSLMRQMDIKVMDDMMKAFAQSYAIVVNNQRWLKDTTTRNNLIIAYIKYGEALRVLYNS